MTLGGRLALASAGALALVASCATPTSIAIDVYTDAPCASHPPASLVMSGSLGELSSSAPSAASTRCEPDGHLGRVVISPGGAKDAPIALALMLRPDGQVADGCLDAKNAAGCIVAKRRLRFERRTEIEMRVDLRLSCLGVVCAEGETCVRGGCVPADISCGAGCDEATLLAQGPARTADGGPVDGGGSGNDAGAINDAGPAPASIALPPTGPFATTELALSLGVDHACVLFPGGQVGCWGANDRGQLGDGTTTPRTAPSQSVAGLPKATALASGNKWSCALLEDGRVMCWGANDRGQLGDGTMAPSSAFAREVVGVSAASAIAAGDAHACAINPTATVPEVRCWGANDRGQLGPGASSPESRTPVVFSIDAVGAQPLVVGAGAGHSCAGAGAQLYCWGDDGAGQLGNGGQPSSPTPAPVQMPANVTLLRLSLGRSSSCMVGRLSGTVNALYCWGSNAFGELGVGTTTPSPIPKGLGTITRFTFGTPDAGSTTYSAATVSTGDFHACQLSLPTEIVCWGRNDVGQLGPGITGDKLNQTPVPGLTGVTSVAARGSSTCAMGGFGVRYFGALTATFTTPTL